MMKRIITIMGCLMVMTTICCSQILPPRNEKKIECYTLCKLLVRDSTFITQIDSLIFQKKCASINQTPNGYFSVLMHKNQCKSKSYHFKMEFNEKPSIGEGAVGFFYLNDYVFIVYGKKIESVFFKTQYFEKFVVEKESIPNIEDVPYWEFYYTKGKLSLVFSDCW